MRGSHRGRFHQSAMRLPPQLSGFDAHLPRTPFRVSHRGSRSDPAERSNSPAPSFASPSAAPHRLAFRLLDVRSVPAPLAVRLPGSHSHALAFRLLLRALCFRLAASASEPSASLSVCLWPRPPRGVPSPCFALSLTRWESSSRRAQHRASVFPNFFWSRISKACYPQTVNDRYPQR